MLQTTGILLQQLLQMSAYILVGVFLFRSGLVNRQNSGALSNLLLYIALPCVIIQSFFLERTAENIRMLAISFLLGALSLLIAMLVAVLFFRHRAIDWFSASFSNAGFMGVPLVVGVLGQEYVCYISGMVALLNVLQWTLGQAVLSGNKENLSLKSIFKSPIVIGFLVGLAAFFSGLALPKPLTSVISGLAACNTPLAMVVLGVFLGQISVKEFVSDRNAYLCSAVRLLVVPVVTLLAFCFVPAEYRSICMALLLAACAPVGSNVAIYAQKLQLDYPYATRTVCLSTILSIVTMPVMYTLATVLFSAIQ